MSDFTGKKEYVPDTIIMKKLTFSMTAVDPKYFMACFLQIALNKTFNNLINYINLDNCFHVTETFSPVTHPYEVMYHFIITSLTFQPMVQFALSIYKTHSMHI